MTLAARFTQRRRGTLLCRWYAARRETVQERARRMEVQDEARRQLAASKSLAGLRLVVDGDQVLRFVPVKQQRGDR